MQQNGLELRILRYAIEVGGDHGRPATWMELRHSIADDPTDCRDDELRAALVKLHSHAFVGLQKWDEGAKRMRFFDEFHSMYEFFMSGSFCVTATSLGCAYWESQLRVEALAERLP